MKTIKARHKLIPAIIMLIVAAITMSTASYAWFTMSNRVEVTGIELTVVAPTNILIREKNAESPNDFSNTVSVLSEFGTGKLSHASSVNGLTMYTVANPINNIDTDGTLKETATITATAQVLSLNTDGYYVDYVLELVNTGGTAVTVGLNNVQIEGIDNSNNGNIEGAVRFAVLEGAESRGVFAHADESDTVNAYNGTTLNTDVALQEYNDPDSSFELVANGYADTNSPLNHKEIVVRVWIEGQDPDCVSAKAGSSFSIEFNFYVVD